MYRTLPIFVLSIALAVTACAPSVPADGSGNETPPASVRIAYFPNLTHAPALIGIERGIFQDALGTGTTVDRTVFNAGPSEIEAVFAGEVDFGYIGPSPAINGYVQSEGDALRIVAGAVGGGAAFIVRADANITKAADLAGKRISTPQLGTTQDVALRSYLLANNLNVKDKGGTVEVIPSSNPDILTLFQKGDIQGAWVPEPWATRLVQEAGGKVFVDERTIWPNGDFSTTVVIVRKAFLDKYPSTVKKLLQAHVDAVEWATKNPVEARLVVNDGLKKAGGASLSKEVIDASWPNLRLAYDPLSATIQTGADHAFKLGFLGTRTAPDLKNLYDLTLLNAVLRERGLPEVKS